MHAESYRLFGTLCQVIYGSSKHVLTLVRLQVKHETGSGKESNEKTMYLYGNERHETTRTSAVIGPCLQAQQKQDELHTVASNVSVWIRRAAAIGRGEPGDAHPLASPINEFDEIADARPNVDNARVPQAAGNAKPARSRRPA
jgi:hypothetical protein